MKTNFVQLNLALAWLWICLGFGCGFLLGLKFDEERWLGGYASFKRRLYRLGHVSFFGLGAINLLFVFTVRLLDLNGVWVQIAAQGFLVGAIAMPACCLVTAHAPRAKSLFLLPVIGLVTGGVLTLWEVIKL